MAYYDGRFAKHRRFRYYLLNVHQRHLAIEQAALFVRNEGMKMSVGELRALSKQSKEEIRRRCDVYGATLRNSAAYFHEKKQELTAMCEQLGDPHVFGTNSHADTHCEYLHKFIEAWANQEAGPYAYASPFEAGISNQEAARRRIENLRLYPHLTAQFFHVKTELFMEHVARGILKANAWWVRYEWQSRGSAHAHYLLWLKDAPDTSAALNKIVQDAASIMFAVPNAQSGREVPKITGTQLQELCAAVNAKAMEAADVSLARREGAHISMDVPREIATLSAAADWWGERASRWNHFWDDQEKRPDRCISSVHACAQPPPLHELDTKPCSDSLERPRLLAKTPVFITCMGAAYNASCRHVKCSTYCLRKAKEGYMYCRFQFPRQPREFNSAVHYYAEPCEKGLRWRLYLPLNDPLAVTVNPWAFAANWSNHDFSIIVDHACAVEYITKYATKPEKKSKVMMELFNEAEKRVAKMAEEEGVSKDASSVLLSYMVQLVGGRDWSAQEVAHCNMSLPTVWSSHYSHQLFTVTIPNLGGVQKHRVRKNIKADDDDAAPATTMNRYDSYLRCLQWVHTGGIAPTVGQTFLREPREWQVMNDMHNMSMLEFYSRYRFTSAGAGSKNSKSIQECVLPCIVKVCMAETTGQFSSYVGT